MCWEVHEVVNKYFGPDLVDAAMPKTVTKFNKRQQLPDVLHFSLPSPLGLGQMLDGCGSTKAQSSSHLFLWYAKNALGEAYVAGASG